MALMDNLHDKSQEYLKKKYSESSLNFSDGVCVDARSGFQKEKMCNSQNKSH